MGETQRQSLFSCPLCGKALMRDNRTYRCPSGHSFDIAKEGYVNLLPANRQHSDSPGDDREMVRSRTLFLDGGWYAPLRETLCDMVSAATAENAVLLDAGCGEGVTKDTDINSLSLRERELCLAWLYVWISGSPTQTGSTTDEDADWKHTEGGERMSANVLKQYLAMANDIFDKYDMPLVGGNDWGFVGRGIRNRRRYR